MATFDVTSKMTKERIAIFASGSGTNAEEFFKCFKRHPTIKIVSLLSNNPQAYAIQRAGNHNLPHKVFSREQFYDSDNVLKYLRELKVTFIVLAGFMWLVPENIIAEYDKRIVNIHPALLPKYGGKGMYGDHVHKAVLNNKETESGITIHYVNHRFDEGAIVFQSRCKVLPQDTPEDLANRIHLLEYKHYPRVVEKILQHEDQVYS